MFIIDVDELDLSFEQLIQILKLFEFNQLVLILDSSSVNDSVSFLDLQSKNIDYKKCILCISKEKLDVLRNISYDADFMIWGCDRNIWNASNVKKIYNYQTSKLICDKTITFSVDVWKSEKQIRIECNSELYDLNSIIEKIKNYVNNG